MDYKLQEWTTLTASMMRLLLLHELSAVLYSGLSARLVVRQAAKKTVVIVQLCYHPPAEQQLAWYTKYTKPIQMHLLIMCIFSAQGLLCQATACKQGQETPCAAMFITAQRSPQSTLSLATYTTEVKQGQLLLSCVAAQRLLCPAMARLGGRKPPVQHRSSRQQTHGCTT